MATNLQQIATKHELATLEAFTKAIQGVKDQAVIAELARLISASNIQGVVDLLQLDPATFRPLENAITAAYEEGGETAATQIGRIPVEAGTLVARFNVRSPRAEQWLRTLSSRRIVEISDETRQVVRNVLTGALAEGQGPRTTALDLVGRIDPQTRKRVGGFIGLAENQANWVRNARMDLELIGASPEEIQARFAAADRAVPEGYDPARSYLSRELRDGRLDGAVRRAADSGGRVKAKQIDTAISRMQARTLRYRGQVIARTESVNALRAGQEESILQAIETGELEEEFATKTWQDTGDGRTRPAHAAADNQTVPVDQPYIVAGEALMYPGDPAGSASNTIQCRCRSIYRMNFAGQAAKRIAGFN